MPSIDIQRSHALGRAAARDVVEKIAERLQQKYGVEPSWDGDTLRFARSGVNGSIVVGDDRVHVQAHMGMLLAPLKTTVEAEIQRQLDEYFP